MKAPKAVLILACVIFGFLIPPTIEAIDEAITYQIKPTKSRPDSIDYKFKIDSLTLELEGSRRREHILTDWIQAQALLLNYKDSLIFELKHGNRKGTKVLL